MARKPNVECNRCGKPTWCPPSKYGTPYRCHPCRKIEPQPTKAPDQRYRRVGRSRRMAICEGCGAEFASVQGGTGWTRHCSRACYLENGRKSRAVPTEWTSRLRRKRREADTPGLTGRQRKNLLAGWLSRECAYCSNPAETIDHVVPLARGGTNYEGNLVPCCKWCNSSKSDLLLIEWRMAKPHGGTITHRPWMDADWIAERAQPRPAKVDDEWFILDVACKTCGHTFSPHGSRSVFCSDPCSYEWTKRVARNAYRRKVGLTEDWRTPAGRLHEAS
jgi:hypothetical protein